MGLKVFLPLFHHEFMAAAFCYADILLPGGHPGGPGRWPSRSLEPQLLHENAQCVSEGQPVPITRISPVSLKLIKTWIMAVIYWMTRACAHARVLCSIGHVHVLQGFGPPQAFELTIPRFPHDLALWWITKREGVGGGKMAVIFCARCVTSSAFDGWLKVEGISRTVY